MIEIKVPTVGESINEVSLAKWLKKDGQWVERDEVLAEIESEKATFEINAEQSGLLKILVAEGDTLGIGDIVCSIDDKATRPADVPKAVTEEKPSKKVEQAVKQDVKASPVAAAIIADKKVDTKAIAPSGTGGKILKQDVLEALSTPGRKAGTVLFGRGERKEKMTQLRKTVSRRLVEAKNTTAMLTTFNEVDMSHVMEIRSQYKDKFKEVHGVGLGFMSFFTKACAFALQEWPAVNAYLNNEEIVYHDFCDISIAVSAPKGLVVPIIRNAESLSMAEVETKVVELATKARDNKLTLEEMQGGTFTITNGGVFGSLMSTPIINIPQSAILGMHKIEDRAVVVKGQVVVRPMMYLALSYDHRIIDGRESVGFLVRVKELLENPAQLLFGKDPVKSLLEL
jgi:2-oxoglutarate dehydrogenase E2 component (dihydrolipoamide succinyltransferase)